MKILTPWRLTIAYCAIFLHWISTVHAFVAIPATRTVQSSSFHSNIAKRLQYSHPPTFTPKAYQTVYRSVSNDQLSLDQPFSSSDELSQHTKLRRLKDRMWVRETLEDLTAAEFACSIAFSTSSSSTSSSSEQTSSIKRKTPAVDFDNLLSNLDRRIGDMCIETTYGEAIQLGVSSYSFDRSLSSHANHTSDKKCWILRENVGMGSVNYNTEQRDALLARLLASRERILHAMSGQKDDDDESVPLSNLDQIRVKLQTEDVPPEEDLFNKTSKKPFTGGITAPELFIREDGTIDWDGALQDKTALKKFGIAVWARINGRNPETVDEESLHDGAAGEDHGSDKVTVKIVETDAIREKRQRLVDLQADLKAVESSHTALLSSAVKAGSAVANVNLATLEPELRTEIRLSAQALDKKKDEVAFQTINYELERIFTYLDGELGNTSTKGYIPLQDRLNVAEFGLLESQFLSLNTQLANGEDVDSDVLVVLLDQTVDLKRRLGIDFYVTGLTFDRAAIKMWLIDLKAKATKGLSFYGKGIELFWNDIVFSSSLIGKALQGYTLKPREVRTLRRTFKDILTFIPVVIILIIPLSPVGHVLVFGAIQRFFPDFFPSCFTERRQNLLSLYETTEFSEYTIEENWQEKIVRLSEATAYRIGDAMKKLYVKIIGSTSVTSDEN